MASVGRRLIGLAVALLVMAGALAVAMVLVLDVHGIRRACLARHLERDSYTAAAALRDRAQQAITLHDYAGANRVLDQALERLGDSYRVGYHADNSEEAVAAAKAAASRSEAAIAAEFKSGALNTRLALFEHKARIWDYCSARLRRLDL